MSMFFTWSLRWHRSDLTGHAQMHQQCRRRSIPIGGYAVPSSRRGKPQQHELSKTLHGRNPPPRQVLLQRCGIINEIRLPEHHGNNPPSENRSPQSARYCFDLGKLRHTKSGLSKYHSAQFQAPAPLDKFASMDALIHGAHLFQISCYSLALGGVLCACPGEVCSRRAYSCSSPCGSLPHPVTRRKRKPAFSTVRSPSREPRTNIKFSCRRTGPPRKSGPLFYFSTAPANAATMAWCKHKWASAEPSASTAAVFPRLSSSPVPQGNLVGSIADGRAGDKDAGSRHQGIPRR